MVTPEHEARYGQKERNEMALSWDWRSAPRAEEINLAWREAIILSTMSTGIGVITEKNWEEFAARWIMVSGIKDRDQRHMMVKTAERAVGLRTNASDETPTKFGKRLLSTLRREAEYTIRRVDELEAEKLVEESKAMGN